MTDQLFIPSLSKIYAERFKRKDFSFITTLPDGKVHEKQKEALEILSDSITNEFCYGGAAGGAKSWTGCVYLAFMCLAYPGTKYFIGREELKRLRDTTYLTFLKVCKRYSITEWEYKSQDHYIQFHNGSRIDLLDLKFLPTDPLFERYGSAEYTQGWIEEAGETNFGAFDTLKSRVGRHLNDLYGVIRKIFVTCNPKKNWLYRYFFNPARKGLLAKGKRYIQALVQDNPFRESGYIEGLQSITDKSKKERLLLGNWDYEDDPSALMEYGNIISCFKNNHIIPGRKYLTIDVARFGDDKSIIILWKGMRAEQIFKLEKKSIVDLNKKVVELQTEHQVSKGNTIADEDGIGGGLIDLNRCIGFVNNSKPINQAKHENYENLRSQCYFRLAKAVEEGELFIFSEDPEEVDLISQELSAIKKKNPDSDEKKVGVISREEIKNLIGRSPDYASSLMMRMRFELSRSVGAGKSHYEDY